MADGRRTAVRGAAERLAERPFLGRQSPGLAPPPYRFWSLQRWRLLIVYNKTTTPVTIQPVVSTDQDLAATLTDLRDVPTPREPS